MQPVIINDFDHEVTENKEENPLRAKILTILNSDKKATAKQEALNDALSELIGDDAEARQFFDSVKRQTKYNNMVSVSVTAIAKASALAVECGVFTLALLKQEAGTFFIPLGISHGIGTVIGLTVKLGNPKKWDRFDYASAFCEVISTTAVNVASNILVDSDNPEYPLDKKVNIFTVTVVLTFLNTIINLIAKDEKLTNMDKARLGAAVLSAVGVLVAIYANGPGEIFMRSEAGLSPLWANAVGSVAAIIGLTSNVLLSMYPFVKSMFFSQPKPVSLVAQSGEDKQKLLQSPPSEGDDVEQGGSQDYGTLNKGDDADTTQYMQPSPR